MNILVLAPHFAPISTVGAVRMISLCNYLKEKHKVTVVTMDTYCLNPAIIKGEIMDGVQYVHYDTKNYDNMYSKKDYLTKVVEETLDNCLNSGQIDVVVVVVSVGPVYPEEAVRVICQRYGVPYIVDFRDLDILDYYRDIKEEYKGKSMKYILRRKLVDYLKKKEEKKLCKSATALVVANPNHEDILAKSYGLPLEKISTILNGYDDAKIEELLDSRCEVKNNSEYTIGCFGKMLYYDKERTIKLFKVVDSLNKKYGSVKIKHVGAKSDENKVIEEKGLSGDIYEGYGVMDYAEGMRIMAECNMCAMVFTQPNSLGTKAYDYIALNKPFINVGPKDIAIKSLIDRFENALLTDDASEIEAYIENLIEHNISTLGSNYNREDYARSKSNRQYEELILRVAGNRK